VLLPILGRQDDRSYTSFLKTTDTDDEGRFLLENLIPNRTYTLYMLTTTEVSGGSVRATRALGTFESPGPGGTIDLGDRRTIERTQNNPLPQRRRAAADEIRGRVTDENENAGRSLTTWFLLFVPILLLGSVAIWKVTAGKRG